MALRLDFGEGTTPLRMEVQARPESVSAARHAAMAYAGRQGADTWRVALGVSEAVTNAVVHAYPRRGRGPIRLAGRLSGDALVVSVADDGKGITPDTVRGRSGHGLSLIATVTDWMSIESPPEGGTRVVMRFGHGQNVAASRF